MNENKKSAKRYHQSVITALKQKVNDMKDSAYSGLYSEIAYIIGISVIMIDNFFPPEKTKANCFWKVILIAVSIFCMFYFARKVKTVNEVEKEKKFWPIFFIQWATGLEKKYIVFMSIGIVLCAITLIMAKVCKQEIKVEV